MLDLKATVAFVSASESVDTVWDNVRSSAARLTRPVAAVYSVDLRA